MENNYKASDFENNVSYIIKNGKHFALIKHAEKVHEVELAIWSKEAIEDINRINAKMNLDGGQ